MKLIFILAVAAAAGCTSKDMKPFDITSEPPGARVEVSGEFKGVTPLTLKLACRKEYVGHLPVSDWWLYKNDTYNVSVGTQATQVNACYQGAGPGKVHFDIRGKQ